MARAIHVRADPPVGPVCATAALARLAHLNVIDVQRFCVQALKLSIGFGIAKNVQQRLARLPWPATLVRLEGLRLRRLANAAGVLAEWNAAPLLDDILEVFLRIAKRHALDRLARLICVLVVHPEIHALRFAGLARVQRLTAELHHRASEPPTP